MMEYRTCLIPALSVQMSVQQQDMEHWTEVRMKHVEKIRAANDIKRKDCTKRGYLITYGCSLFQQASSTG